MSTRRPTNLQERREEETERERREVEGGACVCVCEGGSVREGVWTLRRIE